MKTVDLVDGALISVETSIDEDKINSNYRGSADERPYSRYSRNNPSKTAINNQGTLHS